LCLDPSGEVRIEREAVRPQALLPAAPVAPRPLLLAGGLGEHKWADRRILEGPEALICDLDGEVLEASSGSVFVVEGDALVTPRADGRILPGVTRDVVLSLAEEDGFEVVEEPIDLARLAAADGAFVTSAIRGLQPLAGYDARTARRVAALLRRRWGLELTLVPLLAAA
jgi:para-aminobenzoate synthetase/4-amino-4-deoxychorismate lyase